MIEYPPSDLNILIDQCHRMNEEIHSKLIQNGKILSLSKRSETIL